MRIQSAKITILLWFVSPLVGYMFFWHVTNGLLKIQDDTVLLFFLYPFLLFNKKYLIRMMLNAPLRFHGQITSLGNIVITFYSELAIYWSCQFIFSFHNSFLIYKISILVVNFLVQPTLFINLSKRIKKICVFMKTYCHLFSEYLIIQPIWLIEAIIN